MLMAPSVTQRSHFCDRNLGQGARLYIDLFDTTILGCTNELVTPVSAENLASHFNDDIVGREVSASFVARKTLQAPRAGREHFDVARDFSFGFGLFDFFELTRANLRGNVRAFHSKESRFATAAFALNDVGPGELLNSIQRYAVTERRMARIVIEVTK